MADIILIVDDEDSVRRTFQEWLADRPDLEVRAAADAAAALRLANESPIDLAILDWNLGTGQNGLELLEDLHVFHPDLTAMLVTGYAHQATPLQALRMGVRDYLEKNAQLNRASFVAAVDRLLAWVRPRKRERLVQQGLERFRQAVAALLPHVQTAAHWEHWPSAQASATAVLGYLLRQTQAQAALLWIRSTTGDGRDQWWDAAGQRVEVPGFDFQRSLASAARAMPQPILLATTRELASQGVVLTPAEAAYEVVLACRLDLPAGYLGLIELFDPGPSAQDQAAALQPLASLLLSFAVQEQSVQQLFWRALEEGIRLSEIQDATPSAVASLAEQVRGPLDALERPEVKELTLLLRRLLDRHGPLALASGLRMLREMEQLLDQATGGGA